VPDQKRLADRLQDADALFLVQQQAPPGECAGDVVFARHLARGEYVYLWSNKADVVRSIMGRAAVGRRGELVKPDRPILRPDHQITAESAVRVEKLPADEARYFKELWLHKLDTSQAGWDLALMIDGRLAGIAGVSRPTTATLHNQRDNLLLMYATGAPHETRLTRLVTAACISRPILERFVEPFQMVQVEQLITAELTKHPEIKSMRGLMKLKSRKKDPKYGYRVIYTAALTDMTEADCLAWWLDNEQRWLKSRAKAKVA
jgi:hypothetical protein